MTRWLIADTTSVLGGKIEYSILERPLLHVCCAEDRWNNNPQGGITRLDIRPEMKPDIVADITKKVGELKDNSFAACFGDFPWVESWRFNAARAINEMLRIAPIAYTISPWLLGSSKAEITRLEVSQRPGINHPILFVRYERA